MPITFSGRNSGLIQNVEPLGSQCRINLVDVLIVSGLQLQTKVAAVDIAALIGPLMVDGNDVAAQLGNGAGDQFQLSGLVHELQWSADSCGRS